MVHFGAGRHLFARIRVEANLSFRAGEKRVKASGTYTLMIWERDLHTLPK